MWLIATGIVGELDPVWKALADPTRRAILELLRKGARTTTDIVHAYRHLSRYAVMKHLDVLRNAELIQTRRSRTQRMHSLNVGPIRQVYQSWLQPLMSFDEANLS
jgi:DNA-binding transcriptional ArsR family regulator